MKSEPDSLIHVYQRNAPAMSKSEKINWGEQVGITTQ